MLEDILTVGADDGVTAATNGNAFTAAMRNERLTEALGYLAKTLVNKVGSQGTEAQAEGLVASQSVTLASAGTTLNKDFVAPIRLIKSTGLIYHQGIKSHFDSDIEPLLDYGFAVEGNKVYAYERTAGTLAAVNSGTATLYYIKNDRVNTSTGAAVVVNTTPDTTIDPQWQEFVVMYAAARLAEDKGAGEWQVKANKFMEVALRMLPNA